jgi:hypothetical protein
MVWVTVAAALTGGVFFFWLISWHLKRAKSRHTDIAY